VKLRRQDLEIEELERQKNGKEGEWLVKMRQLELE